MSFARPNNSLEDSDSQEAGQNDSQLPSGRYARKPAVVVELLDLREIKERFGVGVDRLYRAVANGRIRAYGRPGRQKYYSAAEIENWLSASVNGRQRRWSEFDDDALTA